MSGRYFSRSSRERIDSLINIIANYRFMAERRLKKDSSLGIHVVTFEKMINKCYKFIDIDIDLICKAKSIKRRTMTDFGLASTESLHEIEEIYMKARSLAEKHLNPKVILRLAEGEKAVTVEKYGPGFIETKDNDFSLYPSLHNI